MTIAPTKFWAIQYIENILREHGVPLAFSDLITFIVACLVLGLIIWVVDVLGTRVALIYIKHATKRTKTNWDDYLYNRRFFHRIIRLVPAFILLYFVNIIFQGYDTRFIEAAKVIMECVIILMTIASITSFLDATNDVYDDRSKEKSIKGFIQTAKIVIYVIGVIAMISIIFNEDPSKLFVGLGASAAIVTLVFKDTILGFVSSIQLSAQDMIRRGDWIAVPAQNADGIVQEITLSTVKVLNWDNTVTMVPIYSMVSGSFTNWRSMQESFGRRFMRQIYVDITSIRIITTMEIEALKEDSFIAPRSEFMFSIMESGNTSEFMTNLGLYRCYIEAYIRTHPHINHEGQLSVRYLPQTNYGVVIEIYAFSNLKDMPSYERAISDIFEHIMALASTFGIRLFQSPSGQDIRNIKN